MEVVDVGPTHVRSHYYPGPADNYVGPHIPKNLPKLVSRPLSESSLISLHR